MPDYPEGPRPSRSQDRRATWGALALIFGLGVFSLYWPDSYSWVLYAIAAICIGWWALGVYVSLTKK